jgi:acyl-CoA thioesterase-1
MITTEGDDLMPSNRSNQKMLRGSRPRFLAGGFALFVLVFAGTAQAETTRIVAIGASNTSGQAVGAGNAWPALLERMLKAKGYDVTVVNAGVTAETSARTLSRVDSVVTPGTKIVIYDVGGGNDADTGASGGTAANTAQIAQRIRARGAVAINASKKSIVGTEKSNPSAWIAGDPHHHITAQSQARLAASLVPKVTAAIGKPK